MKLFLTTADAQAVARYATMGMLDGAVLGAHEFGAEGHQVSMAREFCNALPGGEITVHVAAHDPHQLVQQAQLLSGLSDDIVVQIPYAVPLYPTIVELIEQGIPLCVVGINSIAQGIMMAKLGVFSIGISMSVVDKQGRKGTELLAELRDIFDAYESETELMAIGVSTPEEFELLATLGVHAAELTPAALDRLLL